MNDEKYINKHANIDWEGFENNKCKIIIHDLAAFKAEIDRLIQYELDDDYVSRNYPALYQIKSMMRTII